MGFNGIGRPGHEVGAALKEDARAVGLDKRDARMGIGYRCHAQIVVWRVARLVVHDALCLMGDDGAPPPGLVGNLFLIDKLPQIPLDVKLHLAPHDMCITG